MDTSELPVLVVDLDNTLLKSDLLFESFWSAFGSDWKVLFGSIAYLCMGKSKLKNYLAKKSRIDVTSLPYNLDVVSYVEAHRQAGGRTALVTASDYSLAYSIAAHLCIFDEVHGSDGNHNLKGVANAQHSVLLTTSAYLQTQKGTQCSAKKECAAHDEVLLSAYQRAEVSAVHER